MTEPDRATASRAAPAKRYQTIGEVSKLLGVAPHILRYWEREFPQLNQVQRRGNRRYYQQGDILLLRQIQSLLDEQGYTVKGARQRLEGGSAKSDKAQSKQLLRQMITDLEGLLKAINA